MYPEMIADAKEEGQDRIAKYFDMVNKVEEVHANLYKKALADPASIKGDFYVCANETCRERIPAPQSEENE